MPPPQALAIAKQKGLDLVEISPTAVPPVCRIMDFGKYQYQEQKRAREARKHQKVIEVKEIKFRPKVDEHDYQFKKKHIERFLEDGDKVKATIFFRGREMAHPEIGRRILERLVEELSRRGDRRNDAADGRQPDAHDPDAAAAGGGGKPKAAAASSNDDQRRDRRARRARSSLRVQRVLRLREEEMPKTEDTPRRRQALQADQEREVSARQGVQAAHPEQQDQEAQARAARHDDRRRRSTRRSSRRMLPYK